LDRIRPRGCTMPDERIEALGDWRGAMLARLRALVKQADPEVVEEWKWRRSETFIVHMGGFCEVRAS